MTTVLILFVSSLFVAVPILEWLHAVLWVWVVCLLAVLFLDWLTAALCKVAS